VLFVESGEARVQERGGAMRELAVGETHYTQPNVEHWHGATPSGPLVQVNIQFGGTTKWLVKTTDAEYNRK
jgi:quercetin dioxygenase-like cupin family protein